MDGREMLQKVVLSLFVLGIFTFLYYANKEGEDLTNSST